MTKQEIFEKWQYIADQITKNIHSNIREDIQQNIKLAIWKSLDSINVEQSIPSYLYAVAYNELKNNYRRYSRIYQHESCVDIENQDYDADEDVIKQAEDNVDLMILVDKITNDDNEKLMLMMIANGSSKKEVMNRLGVERRDVDRVINKIRKRIK